VSIAFVAACGAPDHSVGDSAAGLPGADATLPVTEQAREFADRVSAALVPVDSALAALPDLLRPHAATPTADSILIEFLQDFERTVLLAGRTFDDTLFQRLVWAEGFQGDRWRREQLRRGVAVDSLAAAVAAAEIRLFLLQHGVWSAQGEGRTYLQPHWNRVLLAASPSITPSAREYLRMSVREQTTPTGGDGGVGIPWDSLALRLSDADRILAAYPDAVVGVLVSERRIWYLRAYLTGWDNTPVFGLGNRTLRPEVLQSYERYVATHGATVSGRVVAEYLDVVRASGYQRTAAVLEFLRERSGIPY
jgi:hypothetical protein